MVCTFSANWSRLHQLIKRRITVLFVVFWVCSLWRQKNGLRRGVATPKKRVMDTHGERKARAYNRGNDAGSYAVDKDCCFEIVEHNKLILNVILEKWQIMRTVCLPYAQFYKKIEPKVSFSIKYEYNNRKNEKTITRLRFFQTKILPTPLTRTQRSTG